MSTPDAHSRRRALYIAYGMGLVAIAAVAGLAFLAVRPRALSGHRVLTPSAPASRPASPTVDGAQNAQPRTRLFSPKSFWNRRLSSAPIDANSEALVQSLAAEVQREIPARVGPWLATTTSSTPLYRVPHDQARLRVRLDDQGTPGAAALRKAFSAVPLPKHAKPAAGSDRHLTVWQPSTDRLWEFWGARQAADGWHATWGGAIRGVSKSPGYYTASAWPGATRNWGATATSLPVVGGTITIDDLQRGTIDHALALALPAPRAGIFAWPAQRTDGTGDATSLPEGARLRLDPSIDVGSLHVSQLVRMIAVAAQRYGFVVRDQTHKGISLYGEDPRGQSNPYGRLFANQSPVDLLATFPWDRMQVLRMHLCTHAPCVAG